jgi:hypothetical protein
LADIAGPDIPDAVGVDCRHVAHCAKLGARDILSGNLADVGWCNYLVGAHAHGLLSKALKLPLGARWARYHIANAKRGGQRAKPAESLRLAHDVLPSVDGRLREAVIQPASLRVDLCLLDGVEVFSGRSEVLI